jgi:hypothetical protein
VHHVDKTWVKRGFLFLIFAGMIFDLWQEHCEKGGHFFFSS